MLDETRQEKISHSEYERAFTELAGFLYEQYRKQKSQQQIDTTNDNESDD